MTGSATVRESRLAWARRKPRARAAARVEPLRETPGTRAAAWAQPIARPSSGVASTGVAVLRAAVGEDHRDRAGDQAEGRGAGTAEAAVDLLLEREADRDGGQEGERDDGDPAAVEPPHLVGDQAPLADQQGERGAAVDGDLESLAVLGADVVEVPAEQPGDDPQVGGAGDGEQLGRSLDRAEHRGASGSEPAAGGHRLRSLRRCVAVSLSRRPRRYLIRR